MPLATKNLALGEETTFGTAVSPDTYIEILDEKIENNLNAKLTEDTGNTRYGQRRSVTLAQEVGGDISMNLYPDDCIHFIIGALGSVSSTTAAGETVVYEHTISQAATLKSYTLEVDRETDLVKWRGARIDSVKIEWENEIAKLTVSILAVDEETGSSYTPDNTTAIPFAFHTCEVQFGADLTAAAAASATPVASGKLSYNNNLEVQFASGAETAHKINPKVATAELELKMFFDDTTQRDIYRNQTKKACIITFEGDSIGNAEKYRIKIKLAKINYSEHSVSYEAGSLMEEDLKADGMYDSSNSYMCQIVVTNLKSSYA